MAPQYIYDTNDNPIGVFILINDWHLITGKYPDIEEVSPQEKRPLGLAKSKIIIKDNFDEPIPGFEEYQ